VDAMAVPIVAPAYLQGPSGEVFGWSPQLVAMDGAALLVWYSRDDTMDAGVFAARVPTTGVDIEPRFVGAGAGPVRLAANGVTAVVTWAPAASGANEVPGLWLSRLDANARSDTPTPLRTDRAIDGHAVCALDDGTFEVAWIERAADGDTLMAQQLAVDGHPNGEPTALAAAGGSLIAACPEFVLVGSSGNVTTFGRSDGFVPREVLLPPDLGRPHQGIMDGDEMLLAGAPVAVSEERPFDHRVKAAWINRASNSAGSSFVLAEGKAIHSTATLARGDSSIVYAYRAGVDVLAVAVEDPGEPAIVDPGAELGGCSAGRPTTSSMGLVIVVLAFIAVWRQGADIARAPLPELGTAGADSVDDGSVGVRAGTPSDDGGLVEGVIDLE